MLVKSHLTHSGTTSFSREEAKAFLNCKSKCILVALAVGEIAGTVIVVLAAFCLFGQKGSRGFIAALSAGGTAVIIFGAGFLGIAIYRRSHAISYRLIQEEQERALSVGEEAIMFAKNMVTSKKDSLEPRRFKDEYNTDIREPLDPDIPFLCALYGQVYDEFYNTLKKYPEKTWEQDEVIQAASVCIKISYALCCLTLEDAKKFAKESENNDQKKASIITNQYEYYLSETFFKLTVLYHEVRSGVVYGVNPALPKNFSKEPHLYYPKIDAKFVQSFYEENTSFYQFRELYNDFCEKVTGYVDRKALKKADRRFHKWTQPDLGPTTFSSEPDTLPT